MKPSWDDAPEWANWLAMDEDGEWYWFESEPVWSDWDEEWLPSSGEFERADLPIAQDTKEPRP